MTPVHLTQKRSAPWALPALFYVRPITGAEILADTPVEDMSGFPVRANQTLYAVHRADGARLAVMTDKATALATAHEHDLAIVSVPLRRRSAAVSPSRPSWPALCRPPDHVA